MCNFLFFFVCESDDLANDPRPHLTHLSRDIYFNYFSILYMLASQYIIMIIIITLKDMKTKTKTKKKLTQKEYEN